MAPQRAHAARRKASLSAYSGFARTFIAESSKDRVLGLAAEVAFFAVLSLFPGLLIVVSLLSMLDVIVGADLATAVEQRVVDAMNAFLTEQASVVVASVEGLFEQSRGQLLTVATLGALVTLSGAFAVVINALNLAYDTTEQRSWIRRRLLGLLIGIATLVALVLALATLVVGPFLGTGHDLAELIGLGPLFFATWSVLRFPLAAVGLVVWAATLFHVAPNRRSRWRDALPGAFLTTLLWMVASLGFHLYLRLAAGTNPVIGAFGGAVVVMTWVYLLGLALLLGGELNALLARHGRARRAGATDGTSES